MLFAMTPLAIDALAAGAEIGVPVDLETFWRQIDQGFRFFDPQEQAALLKQSHIPINVHTGDDGGLCS